MLTGGWLYVVALVASFIIATVATPVGVSGAVLLLPFQVGMLGTPSPAVTPTNLLYNVVATPGALYRYQRQHQTGGHLTVVLLLGTVPGVIAGSIIRVLVLPRAQIFDVVIGAVLIPLGGWLLVARQPVRGTPRARLLSGSRLAAISAAVGCVGGIYGIGGGSILAPLLIGSGRSASEVAPATLTATLTTSAAGVVTFLVLSNSHHGPVAPDWGVGIALGLGGVGGVTWGPDSTTSSRGRCPPVTRSAGLGRRRPVRLACRALALSTPGCCSGGSVAVMPGPTSSNGPGGRKRVPTDTSLSVRDWAVLGAVGEGPTHGYAVSLLLAPEGALGADLDRHPPGDISMPEEAHQSRADHGTRH